MMKWLEGNFKDKPLKLQNCALTIGNFDGIHLGHRALISTALQAAKSRRVPSVLLTFSPHPSHVLPRAEPVPIIYPQLEKRALLRELGLDFVCVQDFDTAFSETSSEDFLRQFLEPNWSPSALVVGDDFQFGKSKSGGESLLQGFCDERQCHLQILETLDYQGERVSSSRVRKCLERGDVDLASQILGRPYHVVSAVEKGKQLGRTIGFPTANLKMDSRIYPKNGVYGVQVSFGPESFFGVVNIGNRPTVSGAVGRTLECHILDFSGALYGETLRLEFLTRLRGEKRFDGLESLKAQIAEDIQSFEVWRMEKD